MNEYEKAWNDLKRRMAAGERIAPEKFHNHANPDGTPLTAGGFVDADHRGKRYAAPGCRCSECKGKQVKP